MAKVSALIPSRNERFLVPTVQDLLAKARGDIEIIAVLDGESWPDPPLPDDPRLHVLRWNVSRGMRAAINAAVSMAKGQYLLKCDGHTMWDEGFDEKLKAAAHEDNWILVPRRYALDPETWTIDRTNPKYPVDYHSLSEPFGKYGDSVPGLHGTPWTARRDARKHLVIDDELASQGSAWFMSRRHWDRIGPLDASHFGLFWFENQEMALKTWLMGGAQKIVKSTFFAHLYKGKRYGRGYSTRNMGHEDATAFCSWFFVTDQPFEGKVRTFRSLIEQFAPVPTWTDLDAIFARARRELHNPYAPAAPSPAVVAVPALPVVSVYEPPEPTHNGKPKTAPRSFGHRVRAGFKRDALARLFAESGYTKGAEIGVADGRYSRVLCDAIPGLSLRCVDPWQAYPENPRGGPQSQHDGNYAQAQARLKGFDVTFMKATSMDAVRDVPPESLGFCYIDGHHSFDWVMADLIEWSKRVRSGGMVAGHDFYHFRWAGVVEAVDAYTRAHGIQEWWLCDEREPSFWWVKP